MISNVVLTNKTEKLLKLVFSDNVNCASRVNYMYKSSGVITCYMYGYDE